MKIQFLTLVALCGLLSSAALAQKVTYNFMPGTDFSKYHTYKWVDIPSTVHPNQIVDQEIKQAVNNVLASKGLTQAAGDQADLYVGYQCSVEQQREWDAWGTGGRLGWGGGMGSATSSTISDGTLIVAFFDPSRQLIWRGQATKALNPSGKQQKNLEQLDKAIEKLLKNFPPRS